MICIVYNINVYIFVKHNFHISSVFDLTTLHMATTISIRFSCYKTLVNIFSFRCTKTNINPNTYIHIVTYIHMLKIALENCGCFTSYSRATHQKVSPMIVQWHLNNYWHSLLSQKCTATSHSDPEFRLGNLLESY